MIKQVFDYPTLQIDVDRMRAAETGLSQKDVASSVLTSLASSTLVAPSFYLNPKNGVNYNVVVKVPLPKIQSVNDLMNIPVTPPSASDLLQLGDFLPRRYHPFAPDADIGQPSGSRLPKPP